MDVVQFQEKLREICDLGKQNGNMLTHEQIREHFADTDLETSQMIKVLQYLKLQGIVIEGEDAAAQAEAEEEKEAEPQSNGTSTPLTPEEEAYLKDYLAEVSNGKEVSQEMIHTLFENLADGDAIAEAALTSIYLPVAANMAADMNCAEIHLADLIQEANVVLLTALSDQETERKDDAWLRLQLRKGIIAAIEDQTQQKFQDDCLVAKVEKLESAVKDLTDDDGENRFTIDELAVILDMNVDEIRDILRLTGDDK
ncbi:RNA polymerase sigma factor region1.1 domain-containing protein [Blautia sp. Sow4_E7]|uniref:RNA polymerase sigma factor region1.1 domain-containing protein n=1 Tax=Blautia sp. Sow4_E7 TaxID=3438749 RepID=UPI003F8F20EA